MSTDLPNPPAPNPPMLQPAGPMSFVQTWRDALTKPSEQTFARIASSPNATATTAFIWIFIATLVQFFVSFLVGNAGQAQLLRQLGAGQNLPNPGLGSRLGTVICGAPIAAIIAVVFFAVFLGIMQLIARAFGGHGTFDQLAYAIASIVVPMNLIGVVFTLLAAIPFVGLCFAALSLILGIYALVLEIMAVKGVHQISWLGAAVSALALPLVLFACLACAAIFGLAALGPIIGNVFSSINNSLP
ncbi:MAG: YIP1 family protein [Anaerolineae bacterium]